MINKNVKTALIFFFNVLYRFLVMFSCGIFMILLTLVLLDNLSFIFSMNLIKLFICSGYIIGLMFGGVICGSKKR